MADTFNSPGFLTAIVGRLADITGSEWGQKLYARMRGEEQQVRAALKTGTPEKPVIASYLPSGDFPAQTQLPLNRGSDGRYLS